MGKAWSTFWRCVICIWGMVMLAIAVIVLDVVIIMPVSLFALISGTSLSELKDDLNKYNDGIKNVFADIFEAMGEL